MDWNIIIPAIATAVTAIVVAIASLFRHARQGQEQQDYRDEIIEELRRQLEICQKENLRLHNLLMRERRRT